MKFKIGIVGSGFIAKNFYQLCKNHKNFKISKLLTKTNIKNRNDIDNSILTNNIDYLIKNSDLIFDCSGDAVYSTDVINEVLKNKLPVVTMNSEFHVTVGDYFNQKGFVTEAEGDQPGSLSKLNEELEYMGFKTHVYGIHKGFLDYNPTHKNAVYWSDLNGISLDKTVSFTDGSKAEIESIFIANALDCYISESNREDMEIPTNERVKKLYNKSIKTNKKYVDYFVDSNSPPGVFITCSNNKFTKVLEYLKMGKNYQTFERPYHLCHMEVLKTIKDVINNKKKLLNVKHNRYMPAAISKCNIKEGFNIKNALGSFEFRCVNKLRNIDFVPITLLQNAIVKRNIEENKIITMDDVELPKSKALEVWKNLK